MSTPRPAASVAASSGPLGTADTLLFAFVLSLLLYLGGTAAIHLSGAHLVRTDYISKPATVPKTELSTRIFQRAYGDIHVRSEKSRGGPKPYVRTLAWMAVFAGSLVAIRRVAPLRKCCEGICGEIRRIHPLEGALFLGASLWVLGKPGIIDMLPLGQVIEGIREGVNFYTVSTLQGQAGALPIFPYNPPAYFLLAVLSEAQGVLDSLGLGPAPRHGLLQWLLFVTYLGLAWLMTAIVQALRLPLLQGRPLFYFILLNPLGLYYTLFLGQIDAIVVCLLMGGLYQLHVRKAWLPAFALLLTGLCLAKPQHLLALPPLALLGIALENRRAAGRHLAFMVALSACCGLAYAAFSLAPGFYAALDANPQTGRLAWSEWWALFGGAISINRPIGYAMIATLTLIYLMPERVRHAGTPVALGALGMGIIVACFQASFAHTFGLAIFLFPAVIILATSSHSLLKACLLSVFSAGLLASWGLGLEGDFTMAFDPSGAGLGALIETRLAGIPYTSVVHSVETAAYLGFAALCSLQLARFSRDAD